MNTLILSSLLCLVFSVFSVRASDVTFSTKLSHVTGASASGNGDGLQSAFSDEDEEEREQDEDLSGGTPTESSVQLQRVSKDKVKRRRGKGNKDRKSNSRSKSTTAFSPAYTSGYLSSGQTAPEIQAGHTHGVQTLGPITKDPCSSSHQGYCIHGNCKYMMDLREPVCVCNKGYDGERCGILLLPTRNEVEDDASRDEMVQTVLVVIAIVLSSISFLAILLMICAHYRTHKNFLAAFLGSSAERQKLQKTNCDHPV
ncbi:hypothetical protein UPYG_G00191230 [Umbra pygmaea]|uniref:EGF-like domain-containing protein n=1 Tax=Umbra pygmaea TaxID=75934 RepID=A0ABD0WSU9_UMBPY